LLQKCNPQETDNRELELVELVLEELKMSNAAINSEAKGRRIAHKGNPGFQTWLLTTANRQRP
jgi:hypothetical protein